jgi:GNAT superfamily N-acetyltransferase
MIRPATPDDTSSICQLIRGLAEYERLLDRAVFDENDIRRHLFGPRRFAEVLLAEEAGEVVGYALFFHIYSTFAGKPGIYLEDLFVRPERRGRGHGTALLLELARLAVHRQCGRVEWAVLDWNEPAIGFYRGLGAEPMNEWTVFRLWGDALKQAARAAKGETDA